MHVLPALGTGLAIGILAYGGGMVGPLRLVVGVLVPGAAILVFLVGMAERVIAWARVPVPFRIPTTCGQQRSLPWVGQARLDCPSSGIGVLGRMALEVLLFRSLFRNTRAELRQGPRLSYGEEKFLWLAALLFHYSFLVIFLRHLRFFMEPVPAFVNLLAGADGFFQVWTPALYVTDILVVLGLGYLLYRRLGDPQVRYLSLFSDYFALFLLLGLAGTGILMRYGTGIDNVAAKQLALGLVTFSPVVPATLGPLFFVHVALLSALLAYFPFSKLMHMPGVFLSPTRNLANDNRTRRHVNPWNAPVPVHTYEEWEEEFRDKIEAAGLPLEKA
jgi:nitrate reductase gamma subunit